MYLRVLLVVALVSVLAVFLLVLNYEVLLPGSEQSDQVKATSILDNRTSKSSIPYNSELNETALPPIQPRLVHRFTRLRGNTTEYQDTTSFHAGITEITTTPRPGINPKQINNPAACGQTQLAFTAKGQGAYINSRNYPNGYPNNLDCTYKLTSPVNTKLTMQCDTFNVNCATDHFYFLLGSGNLYNGYCGQGIVPLMTTTGNSLTVIFHSGIKRQASTFRFQCIVRVISLSTPTTTPAPTTPRECSCGVINDSKSNRIVGGTPSKPGEIPWRVGLFIYDLATEYGEICGGTILSPNWILTAAHCTQNFKPGHQINVYAGAQANPVTVGGTNPIVVDRYVQHPQFNRLTLDNDICLLHLTRPLNFTENISPICLPFTLQNFNLSGSTAIASGFGTTKPVPPGVDNNDTVAETLLEVKLPILTTEECRKYQAVSNNMICTYEPGKDTCQGDSGGSLDYEDKNDRFYAVGIVSYGIGCAQTGYPGVYTKVTNYLNWIQDATKESFCNL